MASIQNLTFPVNTSTPGVIKTYSAEVNKETGAMVVYDTTNLFQKDPVLRSDPVVSGGKTKFETNFVGTPSEIDKKFLVDTVTPAANNQRAAYINKNFTKVQKEQIFGSVPGVKNLAAPSESAEGAAGGDQTSGETEANQQQFTEGANELSNINNSIKSSAKTRNKYEDLRYPINLKSETQDCIKFTMLIYSPKPLSSSGISQGNPFGARTAMNERKAGTVVLPIQPSITDSNNVQWSQETLNAGEAIAATAALSGIKGGAGALVESLKSGSELLKNANPELKAAIAAYFAGEAAGVKGLLTRTTGAIVNPNMELLFNGPLLRNFSFSFTMSAREPSEAVQIKKIIRFFKQGMSVKRASTGLFLKTPHTFRIQYLHKDKEHPWLNKIKECALTGCNVNYTPAGNYATYYDGSMTSYEMTLTFGELEPIYDDDYAELVPGGNSDTHIGF